MYVYHMCPSDWDELLLKSSSESFFIPPRESAFPEDGEMKYKKKRHLEIKSDIVTDRGEVQKRSKCSASEAMALADVNVSEFDSGIGGPRHRYAGTYLTP
jgi:hypothetical protein